MCYEVNHPRFTRLYILVQRQLEQMVGPIRYEQNQRAKGKTLIIGAGTGLDIAALNSNDVTDVVLVEPDPSMQEYLQKNYPAYQMISSLAEQMSLAEQEFDTVISSLVLCSVIDIDQVLREVYRVLKPGGQYLFMEHVRHTAKIQSGVQNILNPLWQKVAGGCQLNRDIRARLEDSPLRLVEYRPAKSNLLIPIVAGRAVRPHAHAL